MSETKKFTTQTIPTFKDGKYVDPMCQNLYLWVRKDGASRVWQYRGTKGGVPVTVSLGPVKSVTLAEARIKVTDLRGASTLPTKAKPAVKATVTFRDDALAYHSHMKGEWSARHASYWLQSMTRHVFPKIGAMDTASVSVSDIVSCLEPIWASQHGTAIRLHSRIKATIDYAMDTDDHHRFTTNPADRALRRLPKGMDTAQTPHPSISWQEAPALYKRLAGNDSQAARALQFLMLCCTPRANEINGAKWSEIDADSGYGATFHVSSQRMKSGVARHIPLSSAAVELLNGLTTERTGYIFTGRAGKMIGGTVYGRKRERSGGIFIPFSGAIHADAMQRLLRDELKINCHVHGLRATFRTWVSDHAETVRDHDAAEICLDHVIGNKVHRAYDRADMMSERRELAERWAAFLMA